MGYLVLESGECFEGSWLAGEDRAGEVVFNTSHCGYEEIATDPSYFSQIVVMTAPMQGNYGEDDKVWESKKIWIQGFICLEMQNSPRDKSWLSKLNNYKVPVLDELDTRSLVLKLRDLGTPLGALINDSDKTKALKKAKVLIDEFKKSFVGKDWVKIVSSKDEEVIQGKNIKGPRVAVIDYGSKTNILRELTMRCSEIKVFPSEVDFKEIKDWNPQGVLLTNGPGDPKLVSEKSVNTVKELLGWRFIFGICMGHQILARALGATTYKLKFGHRGGNHPVQDNILNKIYMTSQNHGYAVDAESLPKNTKVSHVNLNDNTVSGIHSVDGKYLGTQFHPESHPGPRDADQTFDFFMRCIQ